MAKQIIYDGSKEGTFGRALAQSLNLFGNSYTSTRSLDEVEQGIEEGELDSVLFIASSRRTVEEGNRISRRTVDTPFLFITAPGEKAKEITGPIRGQRVSSASLIDILKGIQGAKRVQPTLKRDYGFAFEADPQGLTTVLMDQFSEPLLCFRELVQKRNKMNFK